MSKRKKLNNSTKSERTFSSNAIRLSNKELLITAVISALIIFFVIPFIWHKSEAIKVDKNFRLAYDFRDDYWVYKQAVKEITKQYPVVMLGDSVVWGMYVDNEHTIPAMINKKLHRQVVGNLAIDGLHCLALNGLVRYYATAIRGKQVLLYFNPLWLNSKKYDLSGSEKMAVQHPRLVDQFSPSLKCYQEPLATRMGVLLERNLPFFSLLNHLRLTFYENEKLGQWILDHPYTNPISVVTLHIDPAEKKHRNSSRDWSQAGITKQDWHWVMPDKSRQWAAFKATIRLLQERDNKVCVVVGSINPYIMTDDSLKQYDKLQQEVIAWLKKNNIDYIKLSELPSSCYADASHPLAKGYELIVDEIIKSPFMKSYYETAVKKYHLNLDKKSDRPEQVPLCGCAI